MGVKDGELAGFCHVATTDDPQEGEQMHRDGEERQPDEPPFATSSEQISQFSSVAADPISQFPSATCDGPESHEVSFACADSFEDVKLRELIDCDSEGPGSVDSLDIRRALGEQPGNSGGSHLDRVASSSLAQSPEMVHNLKHADTFKAMSQSLPVSAPKFMWETNSFLNSVFNPGASLVDQLFQPPSLKRPAPGFVDLTDVGLDEAPIVKALRKGTHKPVYLDSFSKSSVENDDSKRRSFLAGWVTLVLINCSAFNAFDDALSEAGGRERTVLTQSLGECLATKATSTIGKRLSSMTKYASFCESKGLKAFPLSEKCLYAYMSELHSNKQTSASAGKSFLESVRFSAAMLGLHGLDKDRVPQRVSGLAELLAKRAPHIQQASPLTVAQVSRLEEVCTSSESLQDRAATGALLLMLYSCARASDMARVLELVVDRVQCSDEEKPSDGIAGYLEARALHTKGARSQTHKRTLLPLVAPMVSVSGHEWWNSFIQAREALGLKVEGRLECPLLCRFDENGQPVPSALQASEIGCYLRNLLQVDHGKVNLVRSHSLKVTPLSWTAKAGVDMATRRSLGHHLDTNARSATIYARDAMAPPLRELCRVVRMISRSEFFPDNTRSGRFAQEMGERVPGPTVQDSDQETEESFEMPFSDRLAGDTDDSNTDQSSDASGPEDEDPLDTTTLWEMVEPKFRPNLVKVKPGFQTWMHCQSRVMHLLGLDSRRFVCGRLSSARYSQVLQGASSECTRCNTCYTNRAVIEEARLQYGHEGNGS